MSRRVERAPLASCFRRVRRVSSHTSSSERNAHRPAPIVQVPMHWHLLALLPPLNGADVPFQVDGDVFPGVQAIFGAGQGRLAHGTGPIGASAGF